MTITLIHHPDRGSQYAGGVYRNLLSIYGMICSMSRKGDCWDNAVAESFFHSHQLTSLDVSIWSWVMSIPRWLAAL